MAVTNRFPLPLTLSPPTLFNGFHVSPPVIRFSFRKFAALPTALRLGNRNLRRSIFRSMVAGAGQEAVVPSSVPVRVAHELLQAGHRYLDVRTVDEFNAGHVVGATNIPFMFKVGSGMTKNPNFLEEVSKTFGKDDEILIGCLSGRRSLMAASELSSAVILNFCALISAGRSTKRKTNQLKRRIWFLFQGFTGLTDVAGGYSAWVQNNLPIEQ